MGCVADIAIIGGTGLYSLFEGGETVEPDTPYGPPSATITIHDVAGRRVAFLPRHGIDHQFPPHLVPYRANIWALTELGVTRVLAPCAVGSLRPHLPPGSMVIPDQLIDRTHGRPDTFFGAAAVHVPFADPYCPQLRASLVAAAAAFGREAHDGATMVVIAGPRFGTRAEAAWHRQAGADLVNMTALPEAALAREAALCYASIGVVTDWDAGSGEGDSVTQQTVVARFGQALQTVREVLLRAVGSLPDERTCRCGAALDGLTIPDGALPTPTS